MKVKVERMNLVKDSKSKVKAFVSICIDDSISINDCKIVQGADDLFVTMPTRAYEKDGETKYANIVFVGNEELYDDITESVLDEYEQKSFDEEKKKPARRSRSTR